MSKMLLRPRYGLSTKILLPVLGKKQLTLLTDKYMRAKIEIFLDGIQAGDMREGVKQKCKDEPMLLIVPNPKYISRYEKRIWGNKTKK